MSELFREVTKKERLLYYKREWNSKKLPNFLVKTLERNITVLFR